MLSFFIYCTVFSVGFFAGSYFKTVLFEGQAWKIYRWDENIFGFRQVPIGATLHRSDRVIMALDVPTEQFPKEGVPYGP